MICGHRRAGGGQRPRALSTRPQRGASLPCGNRGLQGSRARARLVEWARPAAPLEATLTTKQQHRAIRNDPEGGPWPEGRYVAGRLVRPDLEAPTPGLSWRALRGRKATHHDRDPPRSTSVSSMVRAPVDVKGCADCAGADDTSSPSTKERAQKAHDPRTELRTSPDRRGSHYSKAAGTEEAHCRAEKGKKLMAKEAPECHAQAALIALPRFLLSRTS